MEIGKSESSVTGINWTYTQLFPNRHAYTLTDPTQFINNHRKLNYKPDSNIQVNLDYLDMIEEASSSRDSVNDHIILGKEFSGHLVIENRVKKSIYLKKSLDIDKLIFESLRRIPKNTHLLFEKDGEIFKYCGTNTGISSWHSALEDYGQFIRANFSSLLESLGYNFEDYRTFKDNFLREKKSNGIKEINRSFIENMYFRIIHLEHGYYELTSSYPKINKITKSSVISKLLRAVENNLRFVDNSYGIYYVSDDQKLFKVMPREKAK